MMSPQEQFDAFLAAFPVRTFAKGEIIIFQGEAPRNAYVIKSGTVKAYNLSVSGDEKPVAFTTAGSAFPTSWIFGKVPSAIYYFEAFSPEVSVYAVNRDEYVAFIKNQPELIYQQMSELLVDQLGKSMRLNALQHSRASDKLIYTLHYLALSHGKQTAPQQIEITLDLTHQDFANLTGLTRETAATELNKLKHQGVINYGKNQPYQLNFSKLNAMLNDQFVADLTVKL
ncbi:MAG: CarD family transcriptional regulator [Candidatus Saccharibacteria bacterium]|nr:CarD family transcriptional regulator [Candidatus Saccharibacteria bacterium]